MCFYRQSSNKIRLRLVLVVQGRHLQMGRRLIMIGKYRRSKVLHNRVCEIASSFKSRWFHKNRPSNGSYDQPKENGSWNQAWYSKCNQQNQHYGWILQPIYGRDCLRYSTRFTSSFELQNWILGWEEVNGLQVYEHNLHDSGHYCVYNNDPS